MLTELAVAGLGVVERADLSLRPGCIALTGETGAGKTMIVAGLSLLLGDRADRSIMRAGATETSVEARFEVPASHPGAVAAMGLMDEAAPDEIIEIVLSRSVGEDGRSRARVNGRLVTLAALAEVARPLIEIAGQHDHHRLVDRNYQRDALDAFAGSEAADTGAEVARLVRAAAAAGRSLSALENDEQSRERELDILRYEIQEIESAALEPGEKEALEAQIEQLEHAADVSGAVDRALDVLGGEAGAGEQLHAVVRALNTVARFEPRLGELAGRLQSAALEASDVGAQLASLRADPDAGDVDSMRQRLAVVTRLERKYTAEGGVPAYLQKATERAMALENASSDIEALRTQRDSALQAATEAAARLSAVRAAAAGRFSSAVESKLAELALAGAGFQTRLEPSELSERGLERVEFLFAANPGEASLPLSKVASGGELSRVALAVSVVVGTGDAPTVVFDEVDAGVGGVAAQSIGRLLAELAGVDGRQVIVVTHLPQVAAWADQHLRIERMVTDGRTSAGVAPVDGAERLEELSRMLAGLPDSDRGRSHAQELLALAAQGRQS